MLVLLGVAVACISTVLCRPHHHQDHCKVENIPVKDNFDIVQFTGVWYDVARTTLKHEGPFIDSGVGVFSLSHRQQKQLLHFTYTGQGDTGGCISPVTATGVQVNNGKLLAAFESTERLFLRGNFWIVSTDYVNYALIYGCNQLRGDGHCHHRHQLVYLLSRTPKLSPSFVSEAEQIIRDTLCVETSQLIRSEHQVNCLPDHNSMLKDDANVVVEQLAQDGDTVEVVNNEAVACAALECDVESLGCKHGLKRDEAGCDTCACHVCNQLFCYMKCEHGFAEDERGCTRCACQQARETDDSNAIGTDETDEDVDNKEGKKVIQVDRNAVVPEFRYDIQEQNTITENESDDSESEDNNEILQDEDDHECPQLTCEIACPHGLLEDEHGCRKCECKQCAIPMCADRCEHGYKLSDEGCETCDCNSAEEDDSAVCPPLNCHVECPAGYKKDEHGCDMCRCNGCPDVQCLMYCPHGYKQNDSGCQYCACRNEEESDKTECKLENEVAMGDLDPDSIVGEWRTLAVASVNTKAWVVRIEKADSGFTVLFRQIWEDGCGPTKQGTWTPVDGKSGEFYAQYGYVSGPIKILHVTESSNYIMLFHCFHTRPDGTCARKVIEILGRNTDFRDEVKMEMLSKVSTVCARPDDFVLISNHGECSIRPSGEPVKSCKLSDFKPQKRVTWSGFEGRWYSVAKLHNRDVDQSGEYLIKPASDGTRISLKYRGSRNGICRDEVEALIAPVDDGSGAFTIYFDKLRAQGMLIYTDNNLALYYECDEETETGECRKGSEFVEVMYRENHAPAYLNMMFRRMLENLCVSADDLVTVDHEVECPVTEARRISDIPSQAVFNSTAYSGTWYTVARLHRTQGWENLVAHLVRTPDDRFILRYTGTKNNQCMPAPTAVVSPITSTNPADFMSQSGRRSVRVKIVYTDYNIGVVYQCGAEGPDGKCLKDLEHVKIISRNPQGITRETIHDMKEYLNAAGVQEDDMKLTPHNVHCALEEENQCVFADLPIQENFVAEMELGRWYVVMSDFNSVQYVKPSLREVTSLPDGNQIHSLVSIRNGECTNRRKVILKPLNNDWSLGKQQLYRGRFIRPEIHVAQADNETMITYSCNEVDENGLCVPGHMYVFVSSRQPTISDAKKETLRPILEQLCINPDELVTYNNSVECEIELTEPTTPICQVDKTPILKKFDIKQAMGKWYVMSRTKGSGTPDSLVLELSPGNGGNIDAKYTGYRQGYCMEEKHFELVQQHAPEEAQLFIKYADNINGILRVVFTDYSHMMLYECGLIESDGSCAGGQASLEILSRVPEQPEPTLQYALTKRLPELCMEADDLEPVPHDISCENFSDDCEARSVPSQENFNVTAFLGTWYSVARLKTSTPWDSGAMDFSLKESGSIEVLHASSREGVCVQSKPSVLDPVQGGKASEWVLTKLQTVLASMKVVYTDYKDVAIIHECHFPNADGSCPPAHRHIDVLSRDPEGPMEGTREGIRYVGLHLCVRRRDFRGTLKPVVCTITRPEERECKTDELPMQEDLNPYTLLGEWYSYARLKRNLAIEASKFLITRGDSYGSKLKMYYAGKRKGGACISGQPSDMEARTDEPSKFTLTSVVNTEVITGELTVLYADENNALIHECYKVRSDGSCDEADRYVEILSRNKKLNPEARDKISDALYKACFTFDDLVLSQHEDGVSCNIPILGRHCSFDDVKLHPDFDYRSIMGKTWFNRARLVPGPVPLWTGAGHMEFSHLATNIMQIAWAAFDVGENGTMQCFMGTDQMQQLDNDAEFVGVYEEGIVTTKVLFADDDLLILFDCKKTDGVCLDGGKEIDINQRDRTTPLTPAAINFIKDVIRTQTCENTQILEQLQVPEPCPSPARKNLGRLCYQDTIVAQENLELSKISGTWFQVARSDMAVDVHWDAGVFHLSVANPQTVRIEFTGRSRYNEDTCLPVYTVDAFPDDRQPAYMKYASGRLEGDKGFMKVIHADDEIMVIYECLPGGQQENHLCKKNKEHVEVYARRTRINSKNFEKVNQVLHDRTCFTEIDLIMANRTTECHLPDHAETRHTAPSCKVLDYPSVASVDYQQFSGLWYEIERTQFQDTAVQWSSTSGHKGQIWEAAVLHYDAIRKDSFNYTYAGYTLRDGLCQGPFVAHTHAAPGEPSHSGHMHLFPGHVEAHGGPWVMHGIHKIVWTNYEEAVVYICFRENDDGTCRKNSEFISIISRTTDIDDSRLHEIHQTIKQSLCVDLTELVQPHRDYEKCLGTLGVEPTVEETSGDGDEAIHVCRKARCRMACQYGFKKDQHGCPICSCAEQAPEEDGSGSGSENMKADLGSGANEAFQTEVKSSGEEPKPLTEEEEALLSEIESLNLVGH